MDCNEKQIARTNADLNGNFSFLTAALECFKARASKNPYEDDEQIVGNDNYVILKLKGEYKLELLVQDKKSLDPLANVTVKFNDNVFFESDNNGIIIRDLARNKNYVATSELEGYMNESISFTTIGRPFGTIKEIINVEKVEIGQKFTMENIFYDYDKWDILPESEIELDKLVKIMNDNPDWKVELGSHTDSRGSDSYNESLSQKRSDSAVEYIVTNGISKRRIVAKGYGETQLVNKCDDGVKCTDAEHRINRRTEFKITDIDATLIEQSSINKDVFEVEGEKNDDIKQPVENKANNVIVAEVTNVLYVEKEEVPGTSYRIQLIATNKTLDVPKYFSKISDMVEKYGISIQKVDKLNKYQLGNFSLQSETVEIRKILVQLG
ncbi:MAG: OmpA family protein, partial [Melioribacteraceae bacterium]|nr:OmpA family protein [Melioribacteraceae bacterium]